MIRTLYGIVSSNVGDIRQPYIVLIYIEKFLANAWQLNAIYAQLSNMTKITSRRNFLRTASVAASAGFTIINDSMFAESTEVRDSTGSATAIQFQVFTASDINADVKTLQAAPGNKSLMNAKDLPFSIVMTTEIGQRAKEFEWHEGRDHIIQVIEGATLYEVGGTPKGGHSPRSGEWLAPASEGCRSLLLEKGDLLVLPRGTPHRRSTDGSVTFTLISIM